MPPKQRPNKKATKDSQIKNPGVNLRAPSPASSEMSAGPPSFDSFENLHNDELLHLERDIEQGEVLDDTASDRQDPALPQDVKQLIATLQNTQNKLQSKLSDLSSQVEKDEDGHTWKKEGLRKQHEIAEKIMARCKQAVNAIDGRDSKTARKYIQQSIDLLLHRIKELRIADSSDGGWETVNLYRSNPVADDSDDDKRIKKAEKLAKEKMALKSRRGRNNRRGNYRRPFYRQDFNNRDFPYRSYGGGRSQDNAQRGVYVPDRRRQSTGNLLFLRSVRPLAK